MKAFVVLASLLLTTQALSRGVVVKCWEVGSTQKTENLVFQTDGGYIHEDVLKVEGKSLTLKSSATESCIDWEFPSVCSDKITATDGSVFNLQLAKSGETSDGQDTLIGYLHNKKLRAIALFCKREGL